MLSALLNKQIIIEKGVSGTTSLSSPTLTYSEYMTTYAGVYVRSGDVRYNENEELVYTTEFTIRGDAIQRLLLPYKITIW